MSVKNVTEDIKYIGVDDNDIVLFENQYNVQPMGVSYNSYIIFDEKITVMDTVDKRGTEDWLANLKEALGDKAPYYLVVSHMEPDHAANTMKLAEMYPDMKVIGNAKTFQMIDQFFGAGKLADDRKVVVTDGETVELGKHSLTFVFAPMVHWPEVMVSYDATDKVLFSADGFGRFGALGKTDGAPWMPQARRYFLNIVGKYGVQVQGLLKKAATLDIETICPLHGPVLTGDLTPYLEAYNIWSSYEPEEPEAIFLAYASIHGNTEAAAHVMAEKLRQKGANVTECNLATADVSVAVASAFSCGKMILACATYDGFMFPPMEEFLTHLKTKNFQKRTVGLIENGTWAPMAAKFMSAKLEEMKNITICESKVSIKSALNAESEAQMDALVDEILK